MITNKVERLENQLDKIERELNSIVGTIENVQDILLTSPLEIGFFVGEIKLLIDMWEEYHTDYYKRPTKEQITEQMKLLLSYALYE